MHHGAFLSGVPSPRRKQTDFENEADDGWEYAFAKDGYAVYRNTNYVPMGWLR